MEEEKSFAELYEDSVKEPSKGGILKGSVVRIDENDVFIDFGSKSEGVVPLTDFTDKSGEADVSVGDEVEVMVENLRGEGGVPKLSKRKADFQREYEILERYYRSGELISAQVERKVKGGLLAEVGEHYRMRAFIPASQVGLVPRPNLDEYVGQTVEARIIQLSPDGLVLSRRIYLEERREEQRQKTLSELQEGGVVNAKVVKIIDKGVFVDLGGLEGFLPAGELSWGRVGHPSDVVSVDGEVQLKVLSVGENYRITLSLKQTTPDPWTKVGDKYKTGERVSGKVVSITDFGVFVELEPGVEGLVHSSELTWTKRFRHPKEIASVGSPVEVIVLQTDGEKKRISLSLRRIEPSPWEVFKELNSPGAKVKGVIRNINELGLFVEVAPGLVGLVRPGEVAWVGKPDYEGLYTKGDEIDVAVINVDTARQKIALGIKQLTEDPWKTALSTYKPNSTVVTGKVLEVVSKRGVFIDLEGGIEGFIKASELSRERNADPSTLVNPGDEVTALVTGFDRSKKQVNLSRNRYEQLLEQERLSSFVSSQGDDSVTLGDVFGDKLKELIEE
ncbi:MAG: 30S ribosomal protein S1 [Thermodesulfobacteriota bacterium]